MSKIITLTLEDNVIDYISDYLFNAKGKIAVISGNKRPALFIKKNLAQKYGKAFVPPSFFTNDEFIEDYITVKKNFSKITELSAAYAVFNAVRQTAPELLGGRTSFENFMSWAFEILSFIEQVDLENVSTDKLKNIKANAEIGYAVPDGINDLLKNIFKIREIFHSALEKSQKTTKGYSFLKAAGADLNELAQKYDEIVLLAPFYLHKTELQIFKNIYAAGSLSVIICGDPAQFNILGRIYKEFSKSAECKPRSAKPGYNLNLYSAFDDQLQAALLKNLIGAYSREDLDKTVVVVAKPEMLKSVISEVSAVTDYFNVSAGYPAAKTAAFSLIGDIICAQLSRRGEFYYAKDVMKVLSNPLVKNMRFFAVAAVSRIIIHKINDALSPDAKTSISGKMFVSFEEILNEPSLVSNITGATAKAWEFVPPEKINKILKEVFSSLFVSFENIRTLKRFSAVMREFLEKLNDLSIVSSYPLNPQSLEILLSVCDDLKAQEISNIEFESEEILNIFSELIKNKKISLPGSPLKGLQILGLLEARNLSFENVFIVGMSEGAMPALQKDSPLIPKDIMFDLGIEMAKREFEIQNYHFQKLIAGSKNLNLIYPENEEEPRSRFIEKLVWQEETKKGLNRVRAKKFTLGQIPSNFAGKQKFAKTSLINNLLKTMSYSHTKIETYLRCRLEFYYRYVLGLDEAEEIGEEISASHIGNFVHDFFSDVFRKNITFEDLKKKEFEEFYLKNFYTAYENSPYFKFREDSFLIKEVLLRRLINFLNKERERNFGVIFACEREYKAEISTANGQYNLYCRIDRVDKKGDEHIICDYKTGNIDSNLVKTKFLKIIEKCPSRKNIKTALTSPAALQLPLYKYIFENDESSKGAKAAQCALYGVKECCWEAFPQDEEIYSAHIQIIKSILDEINGDFSFEYDENDNCDCANCKFFYICR
ncbi:MAG: PD-(D/E)XK nuclease family protein [Elusimicrobiota bacterium]|nr:PD-(D/E)XK nuclease family protein [Elusimicrobiota bacterium]